MHVFVGLAALGGRPDTALNVVLEDEDGQRVDGRSQRRRLLEDVDAVLLALDHPGDAANLSLDAAESPDELRLVLAVRMAEGVGSGARSRGRDRSRRPRWGACGGAGPVNRRSSIGGMILPGSMGCQREPACAVCGRNRVRLSGDDDAVGGASVAGEGDRLLMGQEEGPAASGASVCGRQIATSDGPSFAHASEAELARILDFYAVRWEYEPHIFPILWNLDGAVVESFSPDFYLPDFDTYVELTTLRQPLVRKKNRKLRRLRELYPDIGIKLFYARDFRALMLKYGKFGLVDALSGTSGQVVPGDVVVAVVSDELTLDEAGPT